MIDRWLYALASFGQEAVEEQPVPGGRFIEPDIGAPFPNGFTRDLMLCQFGAEGRRNLMTAHPAACQTSRPTARRWCRLSRRMTRARSHAHDWGRNEAGRPVREPSRQPTEDEIFSGSYRDPQTGRLSDDAFPDG